MARIMNDTAFSTVLGSENMIMVFFQCFNVKLTLKGRVKFFLKSPLPDFFTTPHISITNKDIKWHHISN